MFAYMDTKTLLAASTAWHDVTELERRLDGVTLEQAIRHECKYAISHIVERGDVIPEMYISPDIITFMDTCGVSFDESFIEWVGLWEHVDMAMRLYDAGYAWHESLITDKTVESLEMMGLQPPPEIFFTTDSKGYPISLPWY